jgi:two-component system OmpR family response regulator
MNSITLSTPAASEPREPARAAAKSSHILLVDDDREIRRLLERFLAENGFRVTSVPDGRSALRTLATGKFDLIVLDLMLPGEDGLTICRRVRTDSTVPIIILTAVSADTDRIVGLELGADDYMTKPFNPRELLARARAVLRRSGHVAPKASRTATYLFNGWRLEAFKRELFSPDGVLIELSSGEFDLLLAFVDRPQQVLTRDQLLDLVRGRAGRVFDRAIDVQVSRLRRKVEADATDPKLIKTVRGGGYMFTAPVDARSAADTP